MWNNINALQDMLDDMTEDVKNDAELILEQIDINQLIADPENYIRVIATEFVIQHEEEIQRGVAIGRRIARRILRETNRAVSDPN